MKTIKFFNTNLLHLLLTSAISSFQKFIYPACAEYDKKVKFSVPAQNREKTTWSFSRTPHPRAVCLVRSQLIHFLWTDYNSFILVLSSLSQAYFSCFFDEIFWSLSFRTEILLSFCAISHFLLSFFQQNSNFTVNFSYFAAFSRPRSPCIRGVQEMFSAVRTPLSARSPFRESGGSHAKMLLYEYSFLYTSIFCRFLLVICYIPPNQQVLFYAITIA